MNMIIEFGNKAAIDPVLPVKPPPGTMAQVKAGLPGDSGWITDSKKALEEKGALDVSETADLAANIQNNLNTIHNVNMNFSVHEASGQVMVTISDEKTGEVVREIPSSEILNLAAKLNEMIGLLFDQKG